jgi:hypothetical protein
MPRKAFPIGVAVSMGSVADTKPMPSSCNRWRIAYRSATDRLSRETE